MNDDPGTTMRKFGPQIDTCSSDFEVSIETTSHSMGRSICVSYIYSLKLARKKEKEKFKRTLPPPPPATSKKNSKQPYHTASPSSYANISRISAQYHNLETTETSDAFSTPIKTSWLSSADPSAHNSSYSPACSSTLHHQQTIPLYRPPFCQLHLLHSDPLQLLAVCQPSSP